MASRSTESSESRRFIQAFDFGSGAVKSTLVATGRKWNWQQPVALATIIDAVSDMTVLFSDEVPVLLGEAVKSSADSATIPDDAIAFLTSTASAMRCRGHEEAARSCSSSLRPAIIHIIGICTAVFRETRNGADVLRVLSKAIGCHDGTIVIASQATEGLLGFRTAVAALATSRVQKPTEDTVRRLIVWDSGASSFQLVGAANESGGSAVRVLEGPWGSSKALHAAVVGVKKLPWLGGPPSHGNSANPMCEAQFAQLVALLQASIDDAFRASSHQRENFSWLSQRLCGEQSLLVVGVGGKNCMFRMASLLLGAASSDPMRRGEEHHLSFSAQDIRSAMPLVFNKRDTELASLGFPQSYCLIPKLALAVAVLQLLNIRRVVYTATVGCTLGLLVSPELWSVASQQALAVPRSQY